MPEGCVDRRYCRTTTNTTAGEEMRKVYVCSVFIAVEAIDDCLNQIFKVIFDMSYEIESLPTRGH